MTKKKRLSRDQKRKAKLAKEARKNRQGHSLAYEGKKYKTDALVPVYFETELGIFQAHVITHRKLTDQVVAAAVTKLVQQMRQGPLPPLEDGDRVEYVVGQEEELIIRLIRQNWRNLPEPRPSRDELIGVLRTTLNSIDIWSTPGPKSVGYLHYIEGFLKKQGVRFETQTPDGERIEEPEEDELYEIGQEWCFDHDPESEREFKEMAEELIRSGQAERVTSVCQRLIGEATMEPEVIPELSVLSVRAQQAMKRDMG
jgi:hypothetical protein